MQFTIPTPGPEVKKLGYFVGNWLTQGTIFPGPWGDGGKFSWTEKTEWMPGNFFVIGYWDFTMPEHLGGKGQEIFVMGYDISEALYTFDAFTSQGRHQVSRGVTSDNRWIWTSRAVYSDEKVEQKYEMEIVSAASYRLKFEICEDGVSWLSFMQGIAKKT